MVRNDPPDVLAYRAIAQSDLYRFVRWLHKSQRKSLWEHAEHHQAICDELTRVFHGHTKRLILNLPPRYSKTQLVKYATAWYFGHSPDSEFIYTSYSGRLASASAFEVRNLLLDPEYKILFPRVGLRSDSKAKDHWRTTDGGVMYATGMEGTITGFGAGKMREGFGGALFIDDPHKADEARSATMRRNTINWYQETLQSRLNSPDTPVVVIMQRLHQEDLAGWMLDGGTGEEWRHVCFPAINPDGTALWPAKHSIEELRRMEEAMPYTFAGQYMQMPTPAGGGLFKVDRAQLIDELPNVPIKWVRAWDLASTVNGNFTVGVKLGKLPDGRFVVADVTRFREPPDIRDERMLRTAEIDGKSTPVSVPKDPGQAGVTQSLYLGRKFAGFNAHFTPETGDKVTRAEPAAAQMNLGNFLVLRAPWNDAFFDELRLFPNASHDDQVDALSRAFGFLLKAPSNARIEYLRL